MKYYTVITQNQETKELWFNAAGDYGHLLSDKYARQLFQDIDYARDSKYQLLLWELVLHPDLTISLKVLAQK